MLKSFGPIFETNYSRLEQVNFFKGCLPQNFTSLILKYFISFSSCRNINNRMESNRLRFLLCISSVIGQKGESQNGGKKKRKLAKFFEKRAFLTPWYSQVCMHQGVRNVYFSENLLWFFFLLAVLRFTLLPYYRWFHTISHFRNTTASLHARNQNHVNNEIQNTKYFMEALSRDSQHVCDKMRT